MAFHYNIVLRNILWYYTNKYDKGGEKMKKIIVFCLCLVVLCPCVFAYERSKNLHRFVEEGTLKIYLGDFKSDTDKVSPDNFKTILGDFLAKRKKEHFEIVSAKENSELVIDSKILSFTYLDKDPIDQFVGGTTGLIVDALVNQNYAKVQVEFTVYKTEDMKKIWSGKDAVSVTQTNMPEADSIPKVLNETSKRFVVLCFGRRNSK
jgi:hypothetical protein